MPWRTPHGPTSWPFSTTGAWCSRARLPRSSRQAMGLGIPRPLAFARALEDAGCAPLGEPLTNEALADAIAGVAVAAGAAVAPCAAATADERGE